MEKTNSRDADNEETLLLTNLGKEIDELLLGYQ